MSLAELIAGKAPGPVTVAKVATVTVANPSGDILKTELSQKSQLSQPHKGEPGSPPGAFATATLATIATLPAQEDPSPPEPHPLEGLGLLREDWQFIERRARGVHREALLSGYAERWRTAAAAEPLEFRKANAGRRAANAWLREVGR